MNFGEKMQNRADVLLASLDGTILDVGGSAGTLSEELAKRFPSVRVVCLDIELLHVRPNLVIGDGQQMPFADKSFQSILGGEVIEHIPDPRKFLQESWRVLENNGVLALSTPNKKSWLNRIAHSYEMPHHISLLSFDELQKMLVEEGFTIQSARFFPYTMESSDGARNKWFFPLRGIVHQLMPRDLQEEMVIIARKLPQKSSSTT